MLRDIYKFAVQSGLRPARNRKEKKIAAYVVLGEDGTYERVESIDKKNRTPVSCPDIGNYSFQANCANPIAEKKGYIFPDNEEESNSKHLAWLQIMGDGAKTVPILKTVMHFLTETEENTDRQSKLAEDFDHVGIKDSDFISFRIGDEYLLENSSWNKWFDQFVQDHYTKKEAAETIVSSITGETVVSVPKKGAPMVHAAMAGTGVYPVTIGEPAFESYGLEKNLGAHVGQEEDEAISAGLEYLLTKENHYNSNFGIIHWYDGIVERDVISDFVDNKEDAALEEYLDAMFTGDAANRGKRYRNVRYYISGIAVPTKGRMYLSGFYSGTYSELCRSLRNWYRDSTIHFYWYESKEKIWLESDRKIRKIFQVFFDLLNVPKTRLDTMKYADKMSEVDHQFGEEKQNFLYAIYHDVQIPGVFLTKAILRFTKDKQYSESINLTAVQIIKAYLIRGNYMDRETGTLASQAFSCGKLFAVYEQIQFVANYKRGQENNELNSGISDRFFGAVQKNPQIVFPQLATLSMAHLKKIKSEKSRNFYRRQLGEIAAEIGASFPKHFTDEERGEFILGYYQQSNSYRAPKNRDAEETTAEY